MKTELSKIAQDLEQGTITDQDARKLLLGLLGVSNRPCFGLIEMAVHDHFTSHNGIQEITDEEGKSYTMEFLEYNKEWLGISDDC